MQGPTLAVMYKLLALLVATLLSLSVFTGATSANESASTEPGIDDPTYVGEPPPCETADVATLSAVDCLQSPDPVPSLDDEAATEATATADSSASASPVVDPGLPPESRLAGEWPPQATTSPPATRGQSTSSRRRCAGTPARHARTCVTSSARSTTATGHSRSRRASSS